MNSQILQVFLLSKHRGELHDQSPGLTLTVAHQDITSVVHGVGRINASDRRPTPEAPEAEPVTVASHGKKHQEYI